MNIHFVYPHGSSISCPDAIGRNVGRKLKEKYDVIYYDWDKPLKIKIGKNDILLGHPHPWPLTCFRLNMKQRGWHKIIAMSPYAHGNTYTQVAFFDPIIQYCDKYLAITGNYWFSSIGSSLFSHWLPKMIHLDLAVDRNDFPIVKTNFNQPGKRSFVYIGNTSRYKNTTYLSEIAKAMPDVEFFWIGRGNRSIEGLIPLGFRNFSTEEGKQVVASHDFMITVGNSDANPATILESMSWGLIPVCTPQSGYINYPGIVNIPLDDVIGAVKILKRLQCMPQEQLKEMQILNWKALDEYFYWDRLTQQVIDAIESDVDLPLKQINLRKKIRIRWAALISPYSLLRPKNMIKYLLTMFTQICPLTAINMMKRLLPMLTQK